MRVAALVLGILGGVAGIVHAAFAPFTVGVVVGAEEAQIVTRLVFAAIPLATLGIIGGAVAMAKPKVAGILMLISGTGCFIAMSVGYIVAGPPLIIGGILALAGQKELSKPK